MSAFNLNSFSAPKTSMRVAFARAVMSAANIVDIAYTDRDADEIPRSYLLTFEDENGILSSSRVDIDTCFKKDFYNYCFFSILAIDDLRRFLSFVDSYDR